MPVLPSYRNQYMRTTLAFNGLKKQKKTSLVHGVAKNRKMNEKSRKQSSGGALLKSGS